MTCRAIAVGCGVISSEEKTSDTRLRVAETFLDHSKKFHGHSNSLTFFKVNHWRILTTWLTGWWFQTFFIFHFMYGIIIPTDELIFFRGVGQPPSSWCLDSCSAKVERSLSTGAWWAAAHQVADGGHLFLWLNRYDLAKFKKAVVFCQGNSIVSNLIYLNTVLGCVTPAFRSMEWRAFLFGDLTCSGKLVAVWISTTGMIALDTKDIHRICRAVRKPFFFQSSSEDLPAVLLFGAREGRVDGNLNLSEPRQLVGVNLQFSLHGRSAVQFNRATCMKTSQG